jgi:hypothetical protein
VPEASETASDSEILLAPETGAPLMSSDLTDADTALTGLGTSVLGETDQDYEITDDTMAETAVPTGTGGTTPEVPLEEIEEDVNLDTFGSGSGLLDLSLQADDTSLGGILDEIYTAEDEGKEMGVAEGDSGAAMVAEADQMVPEQELAAAPASPEMATLAGPMIELAPDSQSNTLGMLLFLPLVIVIYTIVVAVAGQRHIMPSILGSIQAFIWYIMGGAAVVAALVVVAAFMFTGERSAAPKAKKEKKPKAIKEKKPKKPKKLKKTKDKKNKSDLNVTIFVTDIGAAAAFKQGGSIIARTPPKTMIPTADSALGLNGALISHFENRPMEYESAPMMSDSEWKTFLDQRFQGREWKRWFGKTPSAIYSIVVVF